MTTSLLRPYEICCEMKDGTVKKLTTFASTSSEAKYCLRNNKDILVVKSVEKKEFTKK